MAWQSSPLALALLASSAVVSALGVVAWRERSRAGAKPFAALMAVVAVVSAAYALQLSHADLAGKRRWATVVTTGLMLVPPLWLAFALEYAGRDRWLTRWRFGALLVPVGVTLVITSTGVPEWIDWRTMTLDAGGGLVTARTSYGPMYVPIVAYSYAVTLAAVGVLGGVLLYSRRRYRGQTAAFLAGIGVPLAGHAVFVSPFDPFGGVRLAPFGFTAMGLCFGLALFRYRFLELSPVATDVVVEEMRDGVLVVDRRGRVVEFNDAATGILETAGDALLGRPVGAALPVGTDLLPAEDDPAASEVVELPGPEERYVEVSASRLGRDRERTGAVLVLRDVTERERREQDLEEYRTLFDTAREYVYVLDADGYVTKINRPLSDLLGYSRSELIGMHATDLVGEDASRRGEKAIREMVDHGESSRTFEFSLRTAGDDRIPCEVEITPLPSEEGFRGSVGVIRNISDRKRAEQQLQRTNLTLETVVESAPLALVVTDRDGVVEEWNPAAAETFGWERETVRGDRLPIVPDERREEAASFHRRLLDGDWFTEVETRRERADGSTIDVSLSAAPLYDADGEVDGTIGIYADITERKRRKQELTVLNRVLRHNLRNDMTVVLGRAEMLRAELDGAGQEHVSAIVETATELTELGEKARKVEAVSAGDADRTVVDLAAVVDAELDRLDDEHPDVDATATVATDRPVRAHEQFQYAVRELLANAASHSRCDRPSVAVTVDEVGGDRVRLTVADDGPGIPEQERRAVAVGTETSLTHASGVGLWLVHWLVRRSGGELSFDVDDGSEVTVTLPVAATG